MILVHNNGVSEAPRRVGRPRTRRGPRPAVAQRLIETRRRLGLSQAKAASDLGVSLATLARWEAGLDRPSRMAERLIFFWFATRLGAGGVEETQ